MKIHSLRFVFERYGQENYDQRGEMNHCVRLTDAIDAKSYKRVSELIRTVPTAFQ